MLPTRFMVLEASRRGKQVEFMSAQLKERCPAGVLVFGLSIMKKDCERGCEQWDLIRRDRPESTDNLTQLPFRYGANIPHTEVIKKAEPLEPGIYSVSAEMGCFIDGEVIAQRVFGRFQIPSGGGEIKNILDSDDS